MFELIDLNTVAENIIMESSSDSSKSGGNTSHHSLGKEKQISPAIRLCFTLNNWTEVEYEVISSIVPHVCRFAIIGSEGEGELSTSHLQGYLEFKTKKRPKSVLNNKRIHWEKAKGDRRQNVDYCSKEGNILLKHPKEKIIKTISKDMSYGS